MRGGLRDALKELLSSVTGRVGVAFFVLMVGVSLYAVAANPLDFGSRLWNNPAVWADHPENAPPAWISIFSSSRPVKHSVLETSTPREVRQTPAGQESA